MDKTEAWRLTRVVGKTAVDGTVEVGRWTAGKWRDESVRRRELRAATKPELRDARRAARRARRVDPRGVRSETWAARRELRRATRAVPNPLWLFAAKSAAAAAVTAYVGLPRVPGDAWLWSAVAVAAGAVGTLVWLVVAELRRRPEVPALEPSAEERALLERLQPEFWSEHAPGRGLDGTLTGRPELTEGGIVVAVRLDGQWTVGKLRAAAEHVRALLGCRTDLRIEIKSGDRGGWAAVTLRTRSAADGVDLTGWQPGAPWGIDTATGESVHVPLGRRMLIAGTSGSGKSWSTRAILAEASEAPDHRLVVIDPKQVEARNWAHRARVAVHARDVLDLTDELVEEMHERLAEIPRGRDVIEISARRPRITLFVDEGAEVISLARDKAYRRVMENLRTLARMARAAEIILIWATQKPTADVTGGIDSQISGQITYRAALALSTATEARTVFGEDATEKGWHAHELPMPGVAMLRHSPKARPHHIVTRAFSPADVIALPGRPIWQQASEAAEPAGRPALRLVKDTDTAPAAVSAPRTAAPAAPVGNDTDAQVLAALDALRPPVRQKDISTHTGLPKGTVSKAVKRLVDAGRLVRHEDGTVSAPAAGEVSA